MPSPEQIEYAEVLLRKAEADLGAVKALRDRAEIADDIVGFHAQQAVEKAANAVLTLHGADYPRTHDLRYLGERLGDIMPDPPASIEQAEWLTAWATEFRYIDPPPPALDRERALSAADAAVVWARSVHEELPKT